MSEQPDNPQDPLEVQLRRWGADEAAQKHASRHGAGWKMPRPSDPWATVRWLAIAATIIVVVSVSLLVVRIMGEPSGGAAQPNQAQVDQLTHQLAEVQGEAEQARQELLAAREQLQRLQSATQAASPPSEQVAALSAEIARLKETLVDANNALAGERKKAAELDVALTGLRIRADRADKLARDLAAAGARLTEANEQINELSRQQRGLIEAEKKLADDLSGLRERTAALMTDFQRVYASVSSGEQTGWRARKMAVRHNRLIERAGGLRATVREEPMRQLIDRVEALLTRLELVDTANPAAVNAFTALVESSGIAEQIDSAMARGHLDASARLWLLEAKLVLTGADHVG